MEGWTFRNTLSQQQYGCFENTIETTEDKTKIKSKEIMGPAPKIQKLTSSIGSI